MKFLKDAVIFFAILSLFSCYSKTTEQVCMKISCWNLQTFFDSCTEGTEYYEYRKVSSTWNRTKYVTRLKRLCKTIQTLSPDVFVMEEIENKSILYDISNMLTVDSWNSKNTYKYGCFASEEGSALGCAVLSRVPLSYLKVHSLCIEDISSAPLMRPLIQLVVTKKNRKIALFVCHWKSKRGGVEKTNIWRSWQEGILTKSLLNSLQTVDSALLCGDFNKDITEFNFLKINDNKIHTQLYNFLFSSFFIGKTCTVFSPWILKDGTIMKKGSYYYKKKWEHIDNFFSAGNAYISDFYVEDKGFWADKDGIPEKYELWTGKGYSDHLPISCFIEF